MTQANPAKDPIVRYVTFRIEIKSDREPFDWEPEQVDEAITECDYTIKPPDGLSFETEMVHISPEHPN